MDDKSFIKLSRKIFSNRHWKEKRVYSRFEAWIDMIQSARFSDEPALMTVKGTDVYIQRGELIFSIRYSSVRWGWSRGKVERFLNGLKNETAIETLTRSGVSIIKLCNYDSYNTNRDSDDTTNRDTNRDTDRDKEEEGKKKVIKKKEKKKEAPVDPWDGLPEKLNLDLFKDKWREWEAYRRDAKIKKLQHKSKVTQWKKMAEWNLADAIESIDQSIANGWQGLFEVKRPVGQSPKAGKAHDPYEHSNADDDEFWGLNKTDNEEKA